MGGFNRQFEPWLNVVNLFSDKTIYIRSPNEDSKFDLATCSDTIAGIPGDRGRERAFELQQ